MQINRKGLLSLLTAAQSCADSKVDYDKATFNCFEKIKVRTCNGERQFCGFVGFVNDSNSHFGKSFTVKLSKLIEIVRSSSHEYVNLSLSDDGNSLEIELGMSFFEMPLESSEVFSFDVSEKNTTSFLVNSQELCDAINKVSYCAAKQDTKFSLTGLCFELGTMLLTLACTDTKRLGVSFVTAETGEEFDKKVSAIVPKKAADAILSTCEHETSAVFIGSSTIMVSSGDRTITSRLLEGRFPPYELIIPKEMPSSFSVNAKHFLDCVSQASIMTDSEHVSVILKQSGENCISVGSVSATKGRSKIEMTVLGTLGSSEVHLAANYLKDFLKTVDGDVTVSYIPSQTGPISRPLVIKSNNLNGLHLIMPLAK